MKDIAKQVAERVAPTMRLPQETQEWVDVVKTLNITKFRRFLKKGRGKLPTKWRGIYKKDDSTLLRLMHSIRRDYPYFTKKDKSISSNFFVLHARMQSGVAPSDLFKKR